jgi:hypothetical protein
MIACRTKFSYWWAEPHVWRGRLGHGASNKNDRVSEALESDEDMSKLTEL